MADLNRGPVSVAAAASPAAILAASTFQLVRPNCLATISRQAACDSAMSCSPSAPRSERAMA
jgi:hypothetical protein